MSRTCMHKQGLTSALVLVLSFTQTGGEKKSAGQTDPNPRPGQAPKNEEEEGLPGKVRGHTVYPKPLGQDLLIHPPPSRFFAFFLIVCEISLLPFFALCDCTLLHPWFCCDH